jgi:NAD(P)-dependent dehydrogenase (short-subunit alcohol dehydrogenase family)
VNELSLAGKIAIVTGAGRGIGNAIARLLAARGAWVAVNDIDSASANSTASSICEAGGSALAFPGDVGNSSDVGEIVHSVLDGNGRLDLLVNNAGIGGTGKFLADLTEEEWARMIQINLGSVFLMCRASVPHMIKQGAGRIINLSSMFGLSGAAGSTHYSASKAGIIGLSKSLARELAPQRITVNVVAPGLIDTPMFHARGVEAAPPWLLWPRIGRPEDVAQTVAFLASDEAEFITGQVISPNGGGWM